MHEAGRENRHLTSVTRVHTMREVCTKPLWYLQRKMLENKYHIHDKSLHTVLANSFNQIARPDITYRL